MDGCSPVQHVRLPCAIREPLSKTAALSEIRIHRAMEAHDVGNVRAKCLSIRRELRKQEEGVDANKVLSPNLPAEGGFELARVCEPVRPRGLTKEEVDLLGPDWQ